MPGWTISFLGFFSAKGIMWWTISSDVAPHSLNPPPLFKGGSKFWLPALGERIQNIKRKGWKYGAGAGFLKRGGGLEFAYLFLSRFIIFTFRNYFTLCRIVLCIWRKLFFSATIILWNKVIPRCPKMNLKICHKLR